MGVGLEVGVVLGVAVGVADGVAVAVGVGEGVGETVGVTVTVAVGVAVAVAVGVAVGVTVGVGVAHPGGWASTLDNSVPEVLLYPPTIIGICPPTTLSVTALANKRAVFKVGPLDQLFVPGS